MRLNVDQKTVGTIPLELISNLLNLITEEDWIVDDYRNSANSMSSTNSIPLLHTPLCFPNANVEAIKSIEERVLFAKYKDVLNPIIEYLRTYYTFTFYSAFLARLHPHSKINAHIDNGSFLRTCHRVHIPIQTNENVKYFVNKIPYYWKVGYVYEFSNVLEHSVTNESDQHRIHLVVNLFNLSDKDIKEIEENEKQNEHFYHN